MQISDLLWVGLQGLDLAPGLYEHTKIIGADAMIDTIKTNYRKTKVMKLKTSLLSETGKMVLHWMKHIYAGHLILV